MKENFLHYLWQYQLFNKTALTTNAGEIVSVEKTGIHNKNSGPDFLEAKLRIDEQLWVGSVEIHLKSSDWYVHRHETDMSYDNVILHVVWEDDMPIYRENNTSISTLEIKGLVPKQIWNNYQNLFQKKKYWIACENTIGEVDSFIWNNWIERLFVERLERKSKLIEQLLNESANDWEAVLFKLLAKNFGLKVNGEAFLDMSQSIGYSTVRKESNEVNRLEALLLGQAGLFGESIQDKHYKELKEIYSYQQHKYQLNPIFNKVQFFRLRPPNFPNIRLSQLANLLASRNNLFQLIMEAKTIDDLYKSLLTQASSYWDTHYVFGKESKKSIKRTTKSFIDLLIINTIIPMRFAYQKHIDKQDSEVLFEIMQALNPEKNSIINKYKDLGIKVDNALESQALLTLKDSYCKPQSCLDCAVGLSILKS